MAFGSVEVGSTGTATLTIANTGNTILTVSSISYPTGFSGAFSGTVAAGGTQNVTVTYTPVDDATNTGDITVNSDATSGTNTISASGTGAYDTDVAGYFVRENAVSADFDYTALNVLATPTYTKAAINTFVKGLKTAGIYSKIVDYWLFIGKSDASHRLAFKGATYNLTKNGTITNDINGSQGNGSNGSWSCPAINLISLYASRVDISAGSYVTTSDSNTVRYEMWSKTTNGEEIQIFANFFGAGGRAKLGTGGEGGGGTTQPGFWSASRTSGTLQTLYRNGASQATDTTSFAGFTGSMLNSGFRLMASDNTTPSDHTTRRQVFSFLGYGLTTAEQLTLYTLLQALQTALGRAV
jgi:hypothetical protein